MKEDEFRKLRVKLPVQPLVNQKPWAIAGWALVILIMFLAAWGYSSYREKAAQATPEKRSISK